MIAAPTNHLLGAALLVAGLPVLSLASGNSNQSDQKPKSAEEVFDSLVRRGEPGMTKAKAEE